MAKKDDPIKILLDDDSRAKLDDLGLLTKSSRSQVVRELIAWRYAMQRKGIPTCANGRPCLVAHMHMIQVKTARVVTEVAPEDENFLVGPPVESVA
jgi:hypothetical protein